MAESRRPGALQALVVPERTLAAACIACLAFGALSSFVAAARAGEAAGRAWWTTAHPRCRVVIDVPSATVATAETTEVARCRGARAGGAASGFFRFGSSRAIHVWKIVVVRTEPIARARSRSRATGGGASRRAGRSRLSRGSPGELEAAIVAGGPPKRQRQAEHRAPGSHWPSLAPARAPGFIQSVALRWRCRPDTYKRTAVRCSGDCAQLATQLENRIAAAANRSPSGAPARRPSVV